MLCEKIAQILLIFRGSDADSSGTWSAILHKHLEHGGDLLELSRLFHDWDNAIKHFALIWCAA
jgi:hypothetical protein